MRKRPGMQIFINFSRPARPFRELGPVKNAEQRPLKIWSNNLQISVTYDIGSRVERGRLMRNFRRETIRKHAEVFQDTHEIKVFS